MGYFPDYDDPGYDDSYDACTLGCGYSSHDGVAWTLDMFRASRLILRLYATRDGVIGGPLHVQLDDFNLHDDQSYNQVDHVDYGRTRGEWEDETGLRAICDPLWTLLRGMSEPERFAVVCHFHDQQRRIRTLAGSPAPEAPGSPARP
jgi:hypothetical protein